MNSNIDVPSPDNSEEIGVGDTIGGSNSTACERSSELTHEEHLEYLLLEG